jgi:hypothetical protein
MGSAYTSVSDDASALYWNPAGLSLPAPAPRQGAIMYRSMSLDRRQAAITWRQRIRGAQGGVGLGLIHAGVDNIDGRDLNGQRTGSLTNSENALVLSFSPFIHSRVFIGVTMKFLIHRLAGQSASGFGGDLGLLFKPVESLHVGAMLRDIRTRIRWDTEGLFLRSAQRRETLPRQLVFGASWRTFGHRLIVAADMETTRRQGTRIHLGTEMDVSGGFTVRAGLRDGRVSAGTGVTTTLFSRSIQFGYVYLSDRLDAGDTHAIEWGIGF